MSAYLLMFAALCGFGWWARGHTDDASLEREEARQ
jgi:hypothetical protein